MAAHVSALPIPGAWKIETPRREDGRGSFHEWFRDDIVGAATGDSWQPRQAHWSLSDRGVLRGISVVTGTPGQSKYVTCARGAVLDVVVDLRPGSPMFGRWHMEQLDEDHDVSLYLGEGLGHAFLSLSANSMLMYLVSQPHDPASDVRIQALGPDLGISWPAEIPVTQSPKDLAAPSLANAGRTGRLPAYTL
ncbi:dTDP-4-dehydrorhamnose 3,5-epimerase [Amycolatopsis sp. WAC 01375]|uniref:dTDP-4-dehydrorhamnose 3,5-epimerase family protein n=1 Tax=Amycolatopsis sp. WAC 01375 TaxID=2203194 RepID=UPI000F774ABB|nr:dTDP-4-dehydrorhamnose 3,5-epimerase family protein [Amycolatopsis sp. WAC 01375]RSM80493.1 dTDP-4-dehydrorhamnose 3,5-epimerase [Amycolatopsis sp. WAC 01375]